MKHVRDVPLVKATMTTLILCLLCASVYAANAPEEDRNKALPVSSSAEQFVTSLDAQQLATDEYFLSVLQEVLLHPTFTEDEKIDSFYLMLKQIGWGFSGTVRLPPHYDYFQVFSGYATTFLQYQETLHSLNYDVATFLVIAERDIQSHVIHASHALLLSLLLAREQSLETLAKLSTPQKFQEAQVPDFLLHYLALGTVLSRQYERALQLGELLPTISSEEGREDLLCMLGMFEVPETIQMIQDFLRSSTPDNSGDLTFETGILVLHHRLSQEELIAFGETFLPNTHAITQLKPIVKHDFHSSFWWNGGNRAMLKTWDGVNLVIYDDGILVIYEDGERFSDFL